MANSAPTHTASMPLAQHDERRHEERRRAAQHYTDQGRIAQLEQQRDELAEALRIYIGFTKIPELNGHLPVFLRVFEQAARAALAKVSA